MAKSASDLQLRELKDTITELRKTISSLQETIAAGNAREKEMQKTINNLNEQIAFLTKKLFGKSSEKNITIPGQFELDLQLFNEAEAEQKPSLLEAEDAQSYEEAPAKKTRKKRATDTERFKNLPVEKVTLDISDKEKLCPVCGTELTPIGTTFVRRELVYVPSKALIREYYSINYECPSCKINAEKPYIIRGKDGKAHMLHGMASSSTVAWIMYQKYSKGMPLYRQESEWKSIGIDSIGRATLANWVIANAMDFFKPMYDYFRRYLLSKSFAMADETPVQVLKEPGRRAEAKSYMWVFRTGEYDKQPVIIYKYSETRAGATAANFLEGFRGYLMCDGYSGYNKVPDVQRTSCWAHARRYLVDAVHKGHENDMDDPAMRGIIYVDKLFALEREVRSKNYTPDAVKKARLQKETPVLEGFWAWVEKQIPEKGSRFDKAITYLSNRKADLMRYLEDGSCSFSNNATERCCKAFVVGRKNWMFSDTPDGAEASAIIYSIVETAKANDLNVYHYLQYLLDMAPNSDMSDEELEKFAPWTNDVAIEITRRVAETMFSPKG